MIIDYKLTYPSGTATAVLINGFHTPKGDVMAKYEHVLFCPTSKVWYFQVKQGECLLELKPFQLLQEAGSWFLEILLNQFPLGFLSMVLYGWS